MYARSKMPVSRVSVARDWAVHNAMPEGRDLDEHLDQLLALA